MHKWPWRVHVRKHTNIHTHIHTRTHTHTQTQAKKLIIYTRMYTHVHAYTCVCVCVCMHVCVCACVCMCVWVHVYACVCVCVCMHSGRHLSRMKWLRSVGFLKLQVSFAKEPYARDDILQKRPITLRHTRVCGCECGWILLHNPHHFICIHVYIHMYTCTHVYLHMYASIHVRVCACVCVYRPESSKNVHRYLLYDVYNFICM